MADPALRLDEAAPAARVGLRALEAALSRPQDNSIDATVLSGDNCRMRGPLWRYPDRKRCYRCRSYFGFLIVDGLYDSFECAGRPDPDADPERWPREHFSWSNGERRRKRSWASERAAGSAARKRDKSAYRCGWCGGWHIGSLRPVEPSG